MKIEQLRRSPEKDTCVVSFVDASKCFDKIDLKDALQSGLACGIEPALLKGLMGLYLSLRRHTSLRMYVDRNHWVTKQGILQGCAASVLLTCCILKRLQKLCTPAVEGFSLIDDRLLIGNCRNLCFCSGGEGQLKFHTCSPIPLVGKDVRTFAWKPLLQDRLRIAVAHPALRHREAFKHPLKTVNLKIHWSKSLRLLRTQAKILGPGLRLILSIRMAFFWRNTSERTFPLLKNVARLALVLCILLFTGTGSARSGLAPVMPGTSIFLC